MSKTAASNPAKKKPKKISLTPQQKQDRKLKADHIRSVRSLFKNAGFERVAEIAEKDVEILGRKGEFDDCFIYENLLVLIEYTTSSSDNVSTHLKLKKIIFDRVVENQEEVIKYLRGKFPLFEARLKDGYHNHGNYILYLAA